MFVFGEMTEIFAWNIYYIYLLIYNLF